MRAALRHLPRLALAGLLACALAAPAPAAENMAQTLMDAVTKSPAARQSGAQAPAGRSGPMAPTPPVVPVTPGAPGPNLPDGEQQSLRQKLQATQPRHIQPAPRASKMPAGGDARPLLLTVEHDGLERRALVRLPRLPAVKKGQTAPKAPALIFLHGAGGSASQAMRQTGLAELATRAGFLAVFPEGLGPANGDGQTWNAWMCCGYARDQKIDDVGFLAALIGRLKSAHNADPRRIYLAGFSNGAMLASRFALERPGAAAAIAVVAGTLPCDAEAPSQALPVLLIHGGQDRVARFGPTDAHPRTGRFCEDYPARAQADFWVRTMGLAAKPQVRDGKKSRVRIEDYAPAKKGGRGSLRYVVVKGGGHAWPGGARERYRYCDLPTSEPDASAMLLEFFRRQGGAPAPSPARGDRPRTR